MGFSFEDAYLNELRSELLSLVGHSAGDEVTSYAIMNDVQEQTAASSGNPDYVLDTVPDVEAAFEDALVEVHDHATGRRERVGLRAIVAVLEVDDLLQQLVGEAENMVHALGHFFVCRCPYADQQRGQACLDSLVGQIQNIFNR